MSKSMLISTSSVGIPKGIFRENGGFRIGLNIYEDSVLWGKIALKHSIAFSWRGGSIYYLDSSNKLTHQIVDFEHPFVKIAENAVEKGQVSATKLEGLKEYIAALKLNFALYNIFLGRNELARETIISCETKMFRRYKYQWLFVTVLPRSAFLSLWKAKRLLSELIFKADYSRDPWLPL